MNPLLLLIGKRLKERRVELHLTQGEVAELLEMSLNFYGEIERGRKRISLEKIILANNKLDLDPTYLLTGANNSKLSTNDIFDGCPKDKLFDMEQLIKYAKNLCKTGT